MATRLSEFADLVHAALGDSTVTKRDDVGSLQQHDVRRRIVWLTQGGQVEQPRQAGGRPPTDGTAYRIQACKVRVEDVQAHLFAETRERTEQLLDSVIAAVCTVVQAAIEMPRYVWETQERENAGKVLRAEHCVLHIRLRLPVPEEIRPLGTFDSVDDVCGTLDEDGAIVPQP